MGGADASGREARPARRSHSGELTSIGAGRDADVLLEDPREVECVEVAHAFGNLEGYRDFPNKARPGDIILAGRNFGAGSSRQQAVDCFKALGIGMILAPSFGAIYFRNAVNSAFPVLSGPRLTEEAEGNRLMTGDEIELDVRSEEGRNLTRNVMFPVTPMSDVQYQIWRSHGLFGYARTISRST